MGYPHRWFSREDSRGCRDRHGHHRTQDDRGREESGHCCWPSQAVRMDELGGRWGQETVMVFPDDYGTPCLVLPLRSTYNLLPTPANHKQWGFTGDDTCAMCKSARGTLRHVLSSCGSSLQMYTWRHNRVLPILAEITETQCRVANEQPTQDPKPCISFLQQGEAPPRQVSKPQGQKFLAAARDWTMAADLKEALNFPHHIVHTQEWPDIVIWSDTVKWSSLWSWLYHGRRTWKKPSRERNSGARIYAWNAKTKDGRVKWCPSRLVVVTSSVEQQLHTWPGSD